MADPLDRRAQTVFETLLSLPTVDRPAAAAAACGADAALLARVRRLLDGLAAADDGFLSDPTAATMAGGPTAAAPPPAATGAATAIPIGERPGDRIGPYKLLEQIGEGGFGVVFKAEQERPVRRLVAVKVIKLGMDTKEVVARFEAERQALALMDHPNIARVFDAGSTAAGRPYFVMELVHGSPITAYADGHRLSTRDRVALAAAVCRAVQHAHGKGVIHRDLKPTNVLVTVADDAPVVKVIDFGIAKATQGPLTDRTLFTAHRQLIGTPQYMSPEQADSNGVDVDTRTDVYSLGVVLYELLVGTTPLDARALRSAAFEAMRKLIAETDPAKPSTKLSGLGETLAVVATNRGTDAKHLSRQLSGELDWIVMRALERDRSRRYDTAAALADDLGRYLAGEAVSAGPPSGVYQLRKLARRHRRAAGVAGAVVAALVVGVAGLGVGLAREAAQRRVAVAQRAEADRQRAEADRQRERAQTQAAVAAAVSEFQRKTFESADADHVLGDRVTVLQAVDAAAHRLDNGDLADRPAVGAGVRNAVGRTYESLGHYDDAERQFREAVRLERAAGDSDPAAADPEAVARTENNLGLDLLESGHPAEAEGLFRDALSIDRRVVPPADVDATTGVIVHHLALSLLDQNRLPEAEESAREAVRLMRAAPPTDERRPLLAHAVNTLATVLEGDRRYADADPLFREALALTRRATATPGRDVAGALNNLGDLLIRQQRPADAEPLLAEAVDIDRRVLPPDHPELAQLLDNLALSLQRQRKSVAAEPAYREALAINRKQPPSEPTDLAVARDLAGLGRALAGRGDLAGGIAALNDALALYQRRLGPQAPSTTVTAKMIEKLTAQAATRPAAGPVTAPAATRP